jgi:hypothetical protein
MATPFPQAETCAVPACSHCSQRRYDNALSVCEARAWKFADGLMAVQFVTFLAISAWAVLS